MKSLSLFFLLWLLVAAILPLRAEPFPRDAAVSLKFPAHAAIGDVVIGEFVIQNTGQRELRFALWDELHVQAKDDKGNFLPQIEQAVHVADFVPSPSVLKPGESASLKIPLAEHVDITSPGVYVVSVWNALGWDVDKADPPPVVTAKIEFQSPTAKYAAARVHALCGKKKTEMERTRLATPSNTCVTRNT